MGEILVVLQNTRFFLCKGDLLCTRRFPFHYCSVGSPATRSEHYARKNSEIEHLNHKQNSLGYQNVGVWKCKKFGTFIDSLFIWLFYFKPFIWKCKRFETVIDSLFICFYLFVCLFYFKPFHAERPYRKVWGLTNKLECNVRIVEIVVFLGIHWLFFVALCSSPVILTFVWYFL